MNQLLLVLRHAEYQARDLGARFGVYGRKNRPRGPTGGGATCKIEGCDGAKLSNAETRRIFKLFPYFLINLTIT